MSTINKHIDHSILKQTLSDRDVELGCETAIKHDVASVCVSPFALKRVAELLKNNTTIQPCTVIGFPNGNVTKKIKVIETIFALEDGATEIDYVINVGKLISGDHRYVEDEIKSVFEEVLAANAKLKVIIETCYLNLEQKLLMCKICSDIQVDWIKTSTGFGTFGATEEDVKLLKDNVKGGVQVKASGGIKTLDDVKRYIDIGATRIGTSNTDMILSSIVK